MIAQDMTEQWIIRVGDREYGPADLETLRHWKTEGRLLPENPARCVDGDVWTTVTEIPGLFESPLPVRTESRSFAKILAKAIQIYGKGFFQFLSLTLLVFVPWISGQLASGMIETGADGNVDPRAAAAAAFAFFMLVVCAALWPIYIAGIQILTARLRAGDRISFLAVLNQSVKFWPRVTFLCLLVYGAFILVMLLALGIMIMLAIGTPSLLSILFAIALLVFQVWMFGRLFMNVLFWQQAAVLEQADPFEALFRSKQLARSGRDLPWFRRPTWRGALIASIWLALVFALEAGPAWESLHYSFQALMSAQDPQALIEALKTTPQTHGIDFFGYAAALLKAILRPLLGIAFVLLYFDSKASFAG
jgi:hypothetical protein